MIKEEVGETLMWLRLEKDEGTDKTVLPTGRSREEVWHEEEMGTGKLACLGGEEQDADRLGLIKDEGGMELGVMQGEDCVGRDDKEDKEDLVDNVRVVLEEEREDTATKDEEEEEEEEEKEDEDVGEFGKELKRESFCLTAVANCGKIWLDAFRGIDWVSSGLEVSIGS